MCVGGVNRVCQGGWGWGVNRVCQGVDVNQVCRGGGGC